MRRFIGIDPGISGALASFDEHRQNIAIHDCPRIPGGTYDRRGMLDLLRHEQDIAGPGGLVITLERPHSREGDGARHGIFDFAMGIGYWLMACTAIGVEPRELKPEVWKPAMLLQLGKGKRTSVEQALRLFPGLCLLLVGPKGGMYHDRAEAVLLCELGRRMWRLGGGAHPSSFGAST